MHSNKFQSELLNGERIVWTGQPDSSVLFTKGDIFLVPFSALWFGFALFWEVTALFIIPKDEPVGLFFPLWGLMFVVMGFYFAIGRFFYKKIKKEKTYYAVTDRRIIILTELFGRRVQTVNINNLPTIDKSSNANGTGSLVFGNNNLQMAMYANSGMELLGWGTQNVPAFYDIRNVEEVYKKITHLQSSKGKE